MNQPIDPLVQRLVARLDANLKEAFERVLSGKDDAGSLTSFLLRNLFKGKSINTPGFLLAALKSEGMVQPSSTVKRCFERTDPSEFTARMRALVNGSARVETNGTAPKAKDAPSKAASGGAPSKKVAVSAHKKTASKTTK